MMGCDWLKVVSPPQFTLQVRLTSPVPPIYPLKMVSLLSCIRSPVVVSALIVPTHAHIKASSAAPSMRMIKPYALSASTGAKPRRYRPQVAYLYHCLSIPLSIYTTVYQYHYMYIIISIWLYVYHYINMTICTSLHIFITVYLYHCAELSSMLDYMRWWWWCTWWWWR